MEHCQRCGRDFEKEVEITSTEELGQIFLGSVNIDDSYLLCPECEEELGMLNLLGFEG